MIHSTRKDRERFAGDEPAGRFSILSVYEVQKLASDKAQIKFERNDISWQKHMGKLTIPISLTFDRLRVALLSGVYILVIPLSTIRVNLIPITARPGIG